MTTCRRYLTFSLRILFVFTTALAVWLGFVVNRAREQREAVKAIEALDERVIYDFEYRELIEPVWPGWMRRIVGDDFFQEVWGVDIYVLSAESESNIRDSIQFLRRLRKLQHVNVFVRGAHEISKETQDELLRALPACEVYIF